MCCDVKNFRIFKELVNLVTLYYSFIVKILLSTFIFVFYLAPIKTLAFDPNSSNKSKNLAANSYISFFKKLTNAPKSMTKKDMVSLRILVATELTRVSKMTETVSAQTFLALATYATIQNPQHRDSIQLDQLWKKLPFNKRTVSGVRRERSVLEELIKNIDAEEKIALFDKYILASSLSKEDPSRIPIHYLKCDQYYQMKLNSQFEVCADKLLSLLKNKAVLDVPPGTKVSHLERIQVDKMSLYLSNNQIEEAKKFWVEWNKVSNSVNPATLEAFRATLDFLSTKPLTDKFLLRVIQLYPDDFSTAVIRRYRALYLIKMNKYDEAQQILEALATPKLGVDTRRNAMAVLNLSEIAYRKKNLEKAIEYAKNATSLIADIEYPHSIQGHLVLLALQKMENSSFKISPANIFTKAHSLNTKRQLKDTITLVVTQIGLLLSKEKLTAEDYKKLSTLNEELKKNISDINFLPELISDLIKKNSSDNKI